MRKVVAAEYVTIDGGMTGLGGREPQAACE
jgi:hypothetical protein